MSIKTALDARLAFIRKFYFTAAAPFEVIRRKYIKGDTQNYDRPLDESEKWEEATQGLDVLGQCSLTLVAKAIQDYLREFVRREVTGPGTKKAKESWFDYYCRCLEDNTSFRWDNSPVARGQIEQINLCRNDFLHDTDIGSSQPKKSRGHFEKHPLSRFDDRLERAVLIGMAQLNGEELANTPGSLTVTRHELLSAIADARMFCTFVETHKNFVAERWRLKSLQTVSKRAMKVI